MKRKDKTPLTMGGELLDDVTRDAMGRLLSLAAEAEAEDKVFRGAGRGRGSGRGRVDALLEVTSARKSWTLETGVGPVRVQRPVIVDRRQGGRSQPFDSVIVPRLMRCKLSYNHHLAWKYVQGLDEGDFRECREQLMSEFSRTLPRSVNMRLTRLLDEESRLHVDGATLPQDPILIWLDVVDFDRGTGRGDKLLVACGLTIAGRIVLMASHRTRLVDADAWTRLLIRLRYLGVRRLPGLVTGLVDHQGALAIKRVFPEHVPVVLDRARVYQGGKRLPPSARSLATMALEDVMSQTRPAVANHLLASFVREHAQRHPKAMEAYFGPEIIGPPPISTEEWMSRTIERIVAREMCDDAAETAAKAAVKAAVAAFEEGLRRGGERPLVIEATRRGRSRRGRPKSAQTAPWAAAGQDSPAKEIEPVFAASPSTAGQDSLAKEIEPVFAQAPAAPAPAAAAAPSAPEAPLAAAALSAPESSSVLKGVLVLEIPVDLEAPLDLGDFQAPEASLATEDPLATEDHLAPDASPEVRAALATLTRLDLEDRHDPEAPIAPEASPEVRAAIAMLTRLDLEDYHNPEAPMAPAAAPPISPEEWSGIKAVVDELNGLAPEGSGDPGVDEPAPLWPESESPSALTVLSSMDAERAPREAETGPPEVLEPLLRPEPASAAAPGDGSGPIADCDGETLPPAGAEAAGTREAPAISDLGDAARDILANRPVSMETLERLLGPDRERIWDWLAKMADLRDGFLRLDAPESRWTLTSRQGSLGGLEALHVAKAKAEADPESPPAPRPEEAGDPARRDRAEDLGEWLHETIERYRLWLEGSETPRTVDLPTAKSLLLSDRPAPLRSLAELLGPGGVGLEAWMDRMRGLDRILPQVGDAPRARYIYLTGDAGEAIVGHPLQPVRPACEIVAEDSDLPWVRRVLELYADHYEPVGPPSVDLVGRWNALRAGETPWDGPLVFDMRVPDPQDQYAEDSEEAGLADEAGSGDLPGTAAGLGEALDELGAGPVSERRARGARALDTLADELIADRYRRVGAEPAPGGLTGLGVVVARHERPSGTGGEWRATMLDLGPNPVMVEPGNRILGVVALDREAAAASPEAPVDLEAVAEGLAGRQPLPVQGLQRLLGQGARDGGLDVKSVWDPEACDLSAGDEDPGRGRKRGGNGGSGGSGGNGGNGGSGGE